MPAEGFAVARSTIAYVVPAVTEVGAAKLAENKPPDPLEKPGMAAVARSPPVGTAGLPVVARIDPERSGVVPVQPLQNRSRSTPTSAPDMPAVNVCPAHEVLVNPNPLFDTFAF